ncbi:MAG: serine hydrolase [Bryobacteraceae bacterium]
MRVLLLAIPSLLPLVAAEEYFPPADDAGGWRTSRAGVDYAALDKALAYIETTTKHGGLLVVRHGALVYERYFGRAHRDAAPNHASLGKSFTSVAVGILIGERSDLFPRGLDQLVFRPAYFPPQLFPLRDARMERIRLGQLLAMTAGIRGNNPSVIRARTVTLDPPGPDGWQAMFDSIAIGAEDGEAGGRRTSAKTLWVEPGGGYSYATAAVHLASIMLRHVTGVELEAYVRRKLAEPMSWGRWGWGYKQEIKDHTPGGGGIAIRPTDMLRFGYLLLREGRWRGSQLVPGWFVRQATKPSPYNPHYGYSLQFNVNGRGHWAGIPRDAFWKTGSGGFCLYVVPSLDVVVFKMGGRDSQYIPENTGLDPAPGFRYDGSREGWRAAPGAADEEGYRETLRLVLTGVAGR